jgi:hypothetical protein
MAKFAVISDGVVSNIIEGNEDSAPLLATVFLPAGGDCVQITEESGLAFIGGLFKDGRFQSPPPYQSWSFDESEWRWIAPTAMPGEDGPWEWNESTQEWQLVTEFDTSE